MKPLKEEFLKFEESYYKKHSKKPIVNIAFSGILGSSVKDAQKRYEQSSYAKNDFIKPNLLGCKNYFQDKLLVFQEEFGVNEFIFLDLSPTFKNKLEGVEILGNLFQEEEENN